MGIVLAIIFLLLAILALVAYGGTPHSGPTSTCDPITFFNHTYSVSGDCRYISVAEGVAAVVFFLLAAFAALSARPRS